MRRKNSGLQLTSQLAPQFLRRMKEEGLNPDVFIERFGLPPDAAEVKEIDLPLKNFHAFSEAASDALGDPWLGLNAAHRLARGGLGVLEFLLRTATTVGEAAEALRQHGLLLNGLMEVRLETRRGSAFFTHLHPGEPLVCGRHGNEFTIAYSVRMVRELSGRPFTPRRVWFAHPSPGDVTRLEETLGTSRLRFGAGENGMEFDAAVLHWDVVGAEPALNAILKEQARTLEARRLGRDTFPGYVKASIERALEQGTPTCEGVARSLKMSSRTLQRQLSERGTTFQRLLDEVRQQWARRYLDELGLPQAEVAYRLRYSDARAFARAYRRWTASAQKPGQQERRARAQSG